MSAYESIYDFLDVTELSKTLEVRNEQTNDWDYLQIFQ
jgi:hypothetical protein